MYLQRASRKHNTPKNKIRKQKQTNKKMAAMKKQKLGLKKLVHGY